MNDITLLRDYHPKHGYETWLVLLSDRELRKRIGREARDRLESRFVESFGRKPERIRVFNSVTLGAGPIRESEGALHG